MYEVAVKNHFLDISYWFFISSDISLEDLVRTPGHLDRSSSTDLRANMSLMYCRNLGLHKTMTMNSLKTKLPILMIFSSKGYTEWVLFSLMKRPLCWC